ncbi:GNAT superfamily N-acetyltransferase [Nakamurella sp. UYEF19]|uniref:GNAT family N-acetyltransferase n=1 Tax=Nakamurella sp. UYEF19 TaxID=1756392 RepID=UPI00339B0B98
MKTFAGYELDDDPVRVDRDALWQFLNSEAYWGVWRTRADVEHQLDAAWRVVGCYHDGSLVGFARAVSDGISFAYLADVYVLREHRGHGLGQAVVEEMIEAGPGSMFRWVLNTADAHSLYGKFGFVAPDSTSMERPSRR